MAVAELHTKWSLEHGDNVAYVASDENPHPGEETDLPIWQADRSAPAEIDDLYWVAVADLMTRYQIGATTASVGQVDATSAMVALVPESADAQRLAVAGGLESDQLHATLIYLDNPDPETWATVVELCEDLATQLAPVEADGFAVSVFNPDTDDACMVLGLGGDDLAGAHDRVVSWLHMAGVDMSGQREPWVPHLTLVYTQDGAELVEQVVDRVGPVRFDRLRVAFGGDVLDYPLAGGVLVAHLPGRHDQRDHGRRRGARSVAPAGPASPPRRTFSRDAASRAYDYDDPQTGISASGYTDDQPAEAQAP